ncbi:MAG: hypothetical protein KDA81_09500 [Planctomycetaceae bacterium]|nr:hypothetical protein [Planctomycetaceae bacterium]
MNPQPIDRNGFTGNSVKKHRRTGCHPEKSDHNHAAFHIFNCRASPRLPFIPAAAKTDGFRTSLYREPERLVPTRDRYKITKPAEKEPAIQELGHTASAQDWHAADEKHRKEEEEEEERKNDTDRDTRNCQL